MTAPTSASPIHIIDSEYVPGACNIGPWEIRRRRASGVVAIAIGVVGLALMLAVGAPVLLRLVLILPFWGGVLSWLQARRRFCAGFAMAGIANFGEGESTRRHVEDSAAHRQDLLAVARMTRDAFLVALAMTVVAVLLPA